MALEFNDKSSDFKKELDRRLRNAMTAVGQTIYDEHLRRITANQSPPTSKPGQYPHRDTGQGADSLAFVVDSDLSLTVGYTLDVGPYPPHKVPGGLHMYLLRAIFDRKGIDHTVIDLQPQLPLEFAKGFQQ